MGSVRFPGKMIASLAGHPVLEWVVLRTLGAQSVQSFVLATSDLNQDDVIEELGKRCGIAVFRGSHENVLRRVIDAATPFAPDAVLRICADNPFVDPRLLDSLVDDFREHWCDYAFNHRPGPGLSVADGFGGEVFDFRSLESVESRFGEGRYREHLTSPFWEHQEVFRIRAVAVPPDLQRPSLRFDVDTPDDLAKLNQLIARGELSMRSTAAEIVGAASELPL
jgi:spore coat polysaccharide biosynthesis protein SpsF